MKIYAFVLMALFLVSFVPAQSQSTELTLQEGWNLVYGFIYTNQIESQYEDNIKAIWGLDSETKEYIRVYPDPEVEKLQALDDNVFGNTAFWVYSDETITTTYTPEEVVPLNEQKLFSGWNFFGSTSESVDKDFDTIKGSCEIVGIYLWNPFTQDWVQLSLSDDIESNALHQGVAIRVNNDCTLGDSVGSGGGPPGLP